MVTDWQRLARRYSLLIALALLPLAGQAQTIVPPIGAQGALRSLTPSEARAEYDRLDPETRQAPTQAAGQANPKYGNDRNLKERLEAWWKARNAQ
jgi:hypothetical protein